MGIKQDNDPSSIRQSIEGRYKHPLDTFPIRFRASTENKRLRIALNIICYVYAVYIMCVVASLMNSPGLDLSNQPRFHLPVLEHNWSFLIRAVLTRALNSTGILMIVILLFSLFSYQDILKSKYRERFQNICLHHKITLFFEHFIDTLYINSMILIGYFFVSILLGLLIGWGIQLFVL